MLKTLRFLLLLGCILPLTGCLEFERQTVSYRHDPKTDILRIFQHYQGIFGADKKEGLSDNEVEQLDSVLKTQRTFFFSNWIFEFSRSRTSDELSRLKEPAEKESPADEAARLRLGALLKLLLDNVQVENVGFHLDDKGRLCGAQRVVVTGVSKLVAAANLSVRDMLMAHSSEKGVSADERALGLRAANGPADFIQFEGNQIRFRYPTTRTDFDKAFGPESDSAKLLEEFRRNGGTVAFANDEMKWTLGKPADRMTALPLPFATKPYVANLLPVVKQQATVREKFDAEAAAKEFLGAAGK